MSWLQQITGYSDAWWVATIQQLVAKHSTPSDDPNHDQTDERTWLRELVDLVSKQLPPSPPEEPYDNNMRAAAILSAVLALWYSRLRRAKSYDPNRPIALRLRAYRERQAWAQELFRYLTDECEDTTYFPGQRWDSPFTRDAESGDFV